MPQSNCTIPALPTLTNPVQGASNDGSMETADSRPIVSNHAIIPTHTPTQHISTVAPSYCCCAVCGIADCVMCAGCLVQLVVQGGGVLYGSVSYSLL